MQMSIFHIIYQQLDHRFFSMFLFCWKAVHVHIHSELKVAFIWYVNYCVKGIGRQLYVSTLEYSRLFITCPCICRAVKKGWGISLSSLTACSLHSSLTESSCSYWRPFCCVSPECHWDQNLVIRSLSLASIYSLEEREPNTSLSYNVMYDTILTPWHCFLPINTLTTAINQSYVCVKNNAWCFSCVLWILRLVFLIKTHTHASIIQKTDAFPLEIWQMLVLFVNI